LAAGATSHRRPRRLFTWDELKRLSNIDKHGIDFADIDEEFFESAIIAPAMGGRFKAIGWFGGVVIAVIFARRGAEAISIISARPASRKERNRQ